MRFKLPLLFLSLAVGVGACSDDDGLPLLPLADYLIQSAQPTLSILQDSSVVLDLSVTRDGEQLKWPGTGVVTINNGTGRARFDPDTVHISAGGSVTWLNRSGINAVVDFRNAPTAVVDIPAPLPTVPPCVTPTGGACANPTFPTNTDSTRAIANASGSFLTNIDSLYTYRHNASDSGFIKVHQSPRLAYSSDDYSIATVSSTGTVTGVNAGSTIIRVAGSGAVLEIPVEVRAKPATSIELTFVNPLDDNARSTEPTIYAYPSDRLSSRLRAVVTAGNDTVFCNRCRNFQLRTQRFVTFSSSDETKLQVSNTANPHLRPDTTGMMTTTDTTPGNTGVMVTLTTADGLSHSIKVHVKLRVIDSLEVRLDSLLDPNGNDPTDKIAYPSMGIRLGDPVVALGVTFRSKVITPLDPNSHPLAVRNAPRWITVGETGTGRRSTLPIVSWETANLNYAEITSTGIVTGIRADAPRSSGTTTPLNSDCLGQAAPRAGSPLVDVPVFGRDMLITESNTLRCVLTCSYIAPTPTVDVPDPLTGRIRADFNARPLPPSTTLANGTVVPNWGGERRLVADTTQWRLATQEAMYTIPNCIPVKTFRMPGVVCTGVAPATGQPNDPTTICQVWMRARANDTATGNLLQDYAAITIRR